MQAYLAIIEKAIVENGLYNFVFFAAVGIFIASMLLCLLIRARYRNKVANLDAELTTERVTHEQERVQLSDNLNAAHEKIQQQEEELTVQSNRIEQIERDKQAAQIGAARAAVLEGEIQQRNQYLLELLNTFEKELGLAADVPEASGPDGLWQRHRAVIAGLANRLQTEERRCSELEQILLTGQTVLAEKEAALEELRNIADEQVAHSAKTEQDFAARLSNTENTFSKLQKKHQVYKAYFGRLAWGRMQVFNDLNLAAHKIHQMETDSQTKEVPIEPITQLDSPQVTEVILPAEANQEVLPEIQDEGQSPIAAPEKTKPANPLFARVVNAVKTDFGLGKQSPEIIEVGDDGQAEPQEGPIEPMAQQDSPQLIEALVPAEDTQEEQPIIGAPEKTKPANPLFARFVNAVKTDFGLGNQSSEKIEAGDGQAEPQQADQEYIKPLAETEAVIEEGQVSDTKHTTISKVLEKTERLPQDIKGQWLGLFKKQTHEISGNEQPLPDDRVVEAINPETPADDEIMPKARNIQVQLSRFFKR
ncbi:MAG: hypothetical protein Q8N96_13905 [Methylovulum sp.]|nr:hypothetical protein [Methylovulum sp.]